MSTVNVCGGTYNLPDFSNVCSSSISDKKIMTYWGSASGDYPLGCSMINDEWIVSSSSTYYNNVNYTILPDGTHIEVGFNAYCNMRGSIGLVCERNSFHGDPIQCCMNNYSCNNSNNLCFSDNDNKNTCDPSNRYLYGEGCEDHIIDFCSGADVANNDPSWLSRWKKNGFCTNIVGEKLFLNMDGDKCNVIVPTGSPGAKACGFIYPSNFNSEGYYWAKKLMVKVFNKYENIDRSFGYSKEFEDNIFNEVCCPYSGVCESSLYNLCKNFTPNDIAYDPRLSRWCGCFLPISQYESYSDNYNISKECTPTCNNYNAIPNAGINNEPVVCQQNVCIIDDITINLVNSSASEIDLNQMCGGCTQGECSCVISGENIDINNTNIQGRIVAASQICGRVTCQVLNPEGNSPKYITTDCTNKAIPENLTRSKIQKKNTIISFFITLSIIIILLVIFFIFKYFLRRR